MIEKITMYSKVIDHRVLLITLRIRVPILKSFNYNETSLKSDSISQKLTCLYHLSFYANKNRWNFENAKILS